MDKFEKLKLKYAGITFTVCPFNKNKYTWKWKNVSGHCVKKENLEFSIENEIEGYLKYNSNITNDEKRILGKNY